MKTRIETVEIVISCDMKDCSSTDTYTDDLSPYYAGWRTVRILVYDKFTDRAEHEIRMYICASCMSLFKDPE